MKKILCLALPALLIALAFAARAVSLEWERIEVKEISGISPSLAEKGKTTTSTAIRFRSPALKSLMGLMPREIDRSTARFLDHFSLLEVTAKEESSIRFRCQTLESTGEGELIKIQDGPLCTLTLLSASEAG